MPKIFKTYTPFSLLALVILALLVKMFWIVFPGSVEVAGHQKLWAHLYEGLQMFLGVGATRMTFLAFINLIGQAIFLNQIANNAHLFEDRNYLPGLCFVLISTFLPEWNVLSPSLIANWLILFILRDLFHLENSRYTIFTLFNIGFALGTAVLLAPSYLVFVLATLISLAVFNQINLKSGLGTIIGLLTPIYLVAGVLFLFNRLGTWEEWLPQQINFISVPAHFSIRTLILIGFSLFVLIFGAIKVNANTDKMIVQAKKEWSAVFIFLVVGLIPFFLSGLEGLSAGLPAVSFAALIVSNIWINNPRKWVSRIIFYLFIIVLIFATWINL